MEKLKDFLFGAEEIRDVPEMVPTGSCVIKQLASDEETGPENDTLWAQTTCVIEQACGRYEDTRFISDDPVCNVMLDHAS